MAFQIGAYKMTIKLINKGGGGGSLPRLEPDLTFPSSLTAFAGYKTITGINTAGVLATALSLTGKFYINALRFEDVNTETITIKLTIDGIVIWNDTFASTNPTIKLFGRTGVDATATNETVESIQCNSSFLLEMQTVTDTAVILKYLARPIL